MIAQDKREGNVAAQVMAVWEVLKDWTQIGIKKHKKHTVNRRMQAQ